MSTQTGRRGAARTSTPTPTSTPRSAGEPRYPRALPDALAVLAPSVPRLAAAVAAGAVALGSAVALTAVASWLISRAAQHPSIVELGVAVVAVRALGIGRGVFRYFERLVSHDVALRGTVRLREQLYLRLASADRSLVADGRPYLLRGGPGRPSGLRCGHGRQQTCR